MSTTAWINDGSYTAVGNLAGDLCAYLQWPASSADSVQSAVDVVSDYVKSYTRGVGFDPSGTFIKSDLRSVILTAAARAAANPSQAYQLTAGSMTATPNSFSGFTVGETLVLDAYRVRHV